MNDMNNFCSCHHSSALIMHYSDQRSWYLLNWCTNNKWTYYALLWWTWHWGWTGSGRRQQLFITVKKQVTVFIVLWFYMILSFLVQESVSMYKDLILCVSITSCIQSLKRMVHFRKVLCEKKLYCNFIYGINMHWTPIYIECLIVY